MPTKIVRTPSSKIGKRVSSSGESTQTISPRATRSTRKLKKSNSEKPTPIISPLATRSAKKLKSLNLKKSTTNKSPLVGRGRRKKSEQILTASCVSPLKVNATPVDTAHVAKDDKSKNASKINNPVSVRINPEKDKETEMGDVLVAKDTVNEMVESESNNASEVGADIPVPVKSDKAIVPKTETVSKPGKRRKSRSRTRTGKIKNIEVGKEMQIIDDTQMSANPPDLLRQEVGVDASPKKSTQAMAAVYLDKKEGPGEKSPSNKPGDNDAPQETSHCQKKNKRSRSKSKDPINRNQSSEKKTAKANPLTKTKIFETRSKDPMTGKRSLKKKLVKGKPLTKTNIIERGPKKRKNRSLSEESLSAEPRCATDLKPKRNRAMSSESQMVTPRQLQLKTTVHRFRHARHIPRAILRLASTPYSRGVTPSPYLAISREGGSVELVSVNERWKCVGEVEGLRSRNVDALTWVCASSCPEGEDVRPKATMETEIETTAPATQHFCVEHRRAEEIHSNRRLIGASRDGTIFEVDFKSKRHTHVIGSGGGSVFCLTSLCPSLNLDEGQSKFSCGSFVAAGCEDGSVRIFNAASHASPGLELICTLPSVGSAILSIAWTGGVGSSMAGSTLYAGVADGTIRKFECDALSSSSSKPNEDSMESMISTHHRWKATTRMTVENRGRDTATKVWALKSLACGTVVSCDSMGSIQFWDGRSGTLLQSFEHNVEKADVLDLAVNYDQSKVMACGINSKVVCIERNDTPGGQKKWVMTAQRRMHLNDVNSLAVVYMTDEQGAAGYGCKNQEASELLCSGGLDTRVFSLATENMVEARPKLVYKYPQVVPLRIARQARILSIMRSDRVDFFQLAEKVCVEKCRPRVTLDENKAFLGCISISGVHNLISMDVTDDGKFLAVSDASSLYMFSLNYTENKTDKGMSRTVIVPVNIKLPLSASAPCSSLKFFPDSSRRLICAPTTGSVKVLKIDEEKDYPGAHSVAHKITIVHTFNDTSLDTETATHNFPITEIAISPDCRFVAISRNTMRTGSITVLSIMPIYAHWYALPCPEAPYSCVKFIGGGSIKPALVVGCSNNSFYIYDVEQKCPSDWSNDLGIPATNVLPTDFTQLPDGPVRLATNPSTPNKFLMGGQNWFCPVDLDMPLPKTLMYHPNDHISIKNNVLTKDDPTMRNYNLAICLLYSGIIFMEFLSEDELVVVEQPWLDILNSLPGALERKRYGS